MITFKVGTSHPFKRHPVLKQIEDKNAAMHQPLFHDIVLLVAGKKTDYESDPAHAMPIGKSICFILCFYFIFFVVGH
jgi:hypothetical protein